MDQKQSKLKLLCIILTGCFYINSSVLPETEKAKLLHDIAVSKIKIKDAFALSHVIEATHPVFDGFWKDFFIARNLGNLDVGKVVAFENIGYLQKDNVFAQQVRDSKLIRVKYSVDREVRIFDFVWDNTSNTLSVYRTNKWFTL